MNNKMLMDEMIKTKNSLDDIRREFNFRCAHDDPGSIKSTLDSNKMLSYTADYLDILIRQMEFGTDFNLLTKTFNK